MRASISTTISSPQHKPKANYVIKPKQKQSTKSRRSFKYKKKEKPLPLLRPQSARAGSISFENINDDDNDNKKVPLSRHKSQQIGRRHNKHKFNASMQNKKDFQNLNKMYRNYNADIRMNDIESSDDGNDIVLINTQHNRIGVPTSQYNKDQHNNNNNNNNMKFNDISLDIHEYNDKSMPKSTPTINANHHSLPSHPSSMDKTQSEPISMNEEQSMNNGNYKSSIKQYDKQETIYSGFLWKCGKIVKNWKLRYFIFCGDYQLRYYTSSALENLKGTADLSPSNVVSVDIDRSVNAHDDNNININPDGGNGYPFVILCKNRTWKFRARTARERQQWVEMLRSVVMYVCVICVYNIKLYIKCTSLTIYVETQKKHKN